MSANTVEPSSERKSAVAREAARLAALTGLRLFAGQPEGGEPAGHLCFYLTWPAEGENPFEIDFASDGRGYFCAGFALPWEDVNEDDWQDEVQNRFMEASAALQFLLFEVVKYAMHKLSVNRANLEAFIAEARAAEEDAWKQPETASI